MNGWLRLAHSLLQGRRCAPDRSCRQGRAWLCRARGAGSDGDVGRCVPLPPLRPQNARLYEFSIKPTVCLSRSSSRPALTGSGSNCTCHADTTGLKQGTLGRDARDCWDPQSSFTARGAPRRRALGWPVWPPRSPAAAVRRRRAELNCVPARGASDRCKWAERAGRLGRAGGWASGRAALRLSFCYIIYIAAIICAWFMNTREGHRIIADEEEKTGVYIESGGPKSPTSAAADPLGERQQQPGSDGKICCDRVVRRVLSCRRCCA